MPQRPETVKVYRTFVKGLVTEAGPLTFPENAAYDEDNVIHSRKGNTYRRLGIDFEPDYVLVILDGESPAVAGDVLPEDEDTTAVTGGDDLEDLPTTPDNLEPW